MIILLAFAIQTLQRCPHVHLCQKQPAVLLIDVHQLMKIGTVAQADVFALLCQRDDIRKVIHPFLLHADNLDIAL